MGHSGSLPAHKILHVCLNSWVDHHFQVVVLAQMVYQVSSTLAALAHPSNTCRGVNARPTIARATGSITTCESTSDMFCETPRLWGGRTGIGIQNEGCTRDSSHPPLRSNNAAIMVLSIENLRSLIVTSGLHACMRFYVHIQRPQPRPSPTWPS